MAIIRGTLQDSTGAALGGYVRFKCIQTPTPAGTNLAITYPVDVKLDSDGSFEQTLRSGTYWVELPGAWPFQILAADDAGEYRIEQIVIWPVAGGGSGTHVWLKSDDGLYYSITSDGTGDALGIVLDPNGTASPSGFIATSIWLKSDDGLYYNVLVKGAGEEAALAFSSTTGSSAPSGVKLSELTVPSRSGSWTNRIVCVGTGETVGLTVR